MKIKIGYILIVVALLLTGCGAPSVTELVTVDSSFEISQGKLVSSVGDEITESSVIYTVKNLGDSDASDINIILPNIQDVELSELHVSIEEESCEVEQGDKITAKLPMAIGPKEKVKVRIDYKLTGLDMPKGKETWRLVVPSIDNSAMEIGQKFAIQVELPETVAFSGSMPKGLEMTSDKELSGIVDSIPNILIIDVTEE